MPTSEHLKSWNLFVFNAILTYIRFHLAVYSVCRKTWSRELRLDTCPQFWSLYANHLVDKPCYPLPLPFTDFLNRKRLCNLRKCSRERQTWIYRICSYVFQRNLNFRWSGRFGVSSEVDRYALPGWKNFWKKRPLLGFFVRWGVTTFG